LNDNTVLSQCLSLLPTEELACPLLNYDNTKLTDEALVKIFIIAQLEKWESYKVFDIKIDAYQDLLENVNLKKVSGSQLSRRINKLDTTVLQNLFINVVNQLERCTSHYKGLTRSEEHTSELQSRENLVCRLLLEKKK